MLFRMLHQKYRNGNGFIKKTGLSMLLDLHSSNCEWNQNGVVRKLTIIHVAAHLWINKQ